MIEPFTKAAESKDPVQGVSSGAEGRRADLRGAEKINRPVIYTRPEQGGMNRLQQMQVIEAEWAKLETINPMVWRIIPSFVKVLVFHDFFSVSMQVFHRDCFAG